MSAAQPLAAQPVSALREVVGDGWLVGGAVRDRLLGRLTHDYDVAVRQDRGAGGTLAGNEYRRTRV